MDVHEHDYWRNPGGTLECACGASKRPLDPAPDVPVVEQWLITAPQSVFEALMEVAQERSRQDARWGMQDHPDGTGKKSVPLNRIVHNGPISERSGSNHFAFGLSLMAKQATDRAAKEGMVSWADILLEEVFEAMAEEDPVKLVQELTQVAAVAVAWVEAIERRLRESGTGQSA